VNRPVESRDVIGDPVVRGLPGVPQAFVDAGDVPWPELEPLLTRQLAALFPGDVLELQSGDPDTLTAVPGWCAGNGFTLIHTQPGDGFVSFWLAK
jgi:hypothetical protein